MGEVVGCAGAAEVIRPARSLLLLTHVSPDGDAVGSVLGLGRALAGAGRRVQMVLDEMYPRTYSFLPSAGDFVAPVAVSGPFDLAVTLDCADLGRVSGAAALGHAAVCLNIDHHATNTHFADYNWVDAGAAAAAEMVWSLLAELGLDLDTDAATCLYTGIATDTGQFRYANTTARTHTVAAELLRAGVQPSLVGEAVYEQESPAKLRLLAESLGTLRLYAGDKIAVLTVTRSLLSKTGADEEDVEGLVGYARNLAGVEVGLLLRERQDGAIRGSLRSRGRVDVAAVAQELGGGGHPRASGCTLSPPLEAAEALAVAAIMRALPTEEAG